jgi:arsenite transporter
MSLQQLESYQISLYLVAIILGLLFGAVVSDIAGSFKLALWPALGVLLYATFTQARLPLLPKALRDRSFMLAVLAGNFLAIPPLVWLLTLLLPPDPAIQLGVLLVLLVPCTDWFITFTHLGRGDTHRAIVATPILLLAQLALLPLYLLLIVGEAFWHLIAADRVPIAFLMVIVLPLFAAWLTERWAERGEARRRIITGLGWLPIPLLAFVLFLIAASQVHTVTTALPLMGRIVAVFVIFLVAAALLGVALGRLFRLKAPAARTLIFSLGTRNSFVVLPLALALSQQWAIAVVVIVLQSLVELFGMVAYLRIVPRLVPDASADDPRHATKRQSS